MRLAAISYLLRTGEHGPKPATTHLRKRRAERISRARLGAYSLGLLRDEGTHLLVSAELRSVPVWPTQYFSP